MKAGVIVNPVAGSRRKRGRLSELELVLRSHFSDLTVCKTSGPGDAGLLAQRMCTTGVELVIAVGGDGTIGEVADGILTHEGARPALGIISCGTGSDFARTIGQPGNLEEQVLRIVSGQRRLIDIGRVTYSNRAGQHTFRHFINVASFGLSGATALAVNSARQTSRLPGRILFLGHTVRELIRYQFQDVVMSLDGAPPISAQIAVVAAANGRFFGSGMMVAPGAQIDDGLLEYVIIRGASKLTLIHDLQLLYSGRHVGHPAVTMLRGKRLEVSAIGQADVRIEIDGETVGQLPATFEIVPQALTLLK
jgi:diacylglycerol kinase (ATP)